MNRHTITTVTGMTLLLFSLLLLWSCSGPQPLSQAIRSEDQAMYEKMVPTEATSPRTAFIQQRAKEKGISFAEAERLDQALPATENPFSARKDPSAVSRGAVLFKANCIKCHGPNADGAGTDFAQPVEELSFHDFGTRFAVTLHGGAPKKWFRVINEGAEPLEVDWTDQPLVMNGYRDQLAREQIWLLVTYLQSVDADIIDRENQRAADSRGSEHPHDGS